MDLTLFAQADPAPLSWGLRSSLSTMHFLEFAIWGVWWVVLGNYLNTLGFTRKQIGRVYATMALGSIVAPLFMGTIADRYLASEWVMAGSHIIGGILLFALAKIRDPKAFYWTTLAYCLAYSPTLSLVNSIVFTHADVSHFPTIRVLGTIGWILAGLSLKLVIPVGQPMNNRPLLIAGALSIVLGIFSFVALPHTPPTAEEGTIPFMQALELLQEPSFAVFFGVSFVITIALAFYFSFTALYLEQKVGVKPRDIGPMMSIGQFVEIFFMFTLAWFVESLGMKMVLVIGMFAWALRYGLFAVGRPFPLIIAGIALHGICFDFFFAAGFMHVDNTAPKAIAASGQALFAVLTYGLGMYIGTEASGWLNQKLTTEETHPETGETIKVTDWRKFWLVPCIGAAASLVLFVLLFR
ncbi:MAG: MFS transporter [Planctomycetaceae bacterium]|nr:MFS transporter [Planctomycetaceae bacterium]